jgi:putative membrane protein
VSAVGTSVFGVVTTIYMPPLVTKYTNEFGMFGITIALIGWLLAACGVLVASAAVGAEFDASRETWVVALKTRYALFDPAAGVPTVDEQAAASGLNRGDLLMFFRVLVNWLILAAAVWAATAIVPGISVPGGFLTLLVVSLLLGLVNAVLGPLLHLVALPLTLLTLGTFALVVNGVLLAVTAGISDKLDADGLGSCILGALVISVVTTALELVLRPVVQVGKGARAR